MKKIILGAGLIAAAVFTMSGAALANADDVKWIGKCVADNQDQHQSADVIKSYCTCMDNKMSSNETQSITDWEKTHKTEADKCSAQAGWK